MQMSAPDESTARKVLQKNDRGLKLRRAMADAWGACVNQYPARAWWRRKSTRAAIMWEHAVQNAILAFDDDSEIKPVRHYDTMSFVMDDVLLLRIKKANIEL